ncbi:MAG: serine/threonine protein kinase [Sandaracinaceae bacterium]|nr:serine/threonine protein kinase [Sandaracinaceae bacterium]
MRGTTPQSGTQVGTVCDDAGAVEIDRYVLQSELGRGAFGAVYLARHKILGSQVALKLLHPAQSQDAASVDRFLREARAAASIGNPHIVRVSDAGVTPDQRAFLAMELLEGEDLASLLARRQRLTAHETVFIGRQVLDGLAAAHAAGIVHRDMKLANVFLARDPHGQPFVKILDFGVSKMKQPVGLDGSLTATGTVVGTPHYMAPEQLVESRSVDGRADLDSVGVMLYELIAGRLPYTAETLGGLIKEVLTGEPLPLMSVAPDVPPAVAQVVTHALAKEPAQRFQSAQQMSEALAHALGGVAPPIIPVTSASVPGPSVATGLDQVGVRTHPIAAPAPLAATLPSGLQPPGMQPPGMQPPGMQTGPMAAPPLVAAIAPPASLPAPAPAGRTWKIATLALATLLVACPSTICIAGLAMRDRVGAAWAAFAGGGAGGGGSSAGSTAGGSGGGGLLGLGPSEPVIPMHDGTEEAVGSAGVSIERCSRRRGADGRWYVDMPVTVRNVGESGLTIQQSELTADGFVATAESDFPTWGMTAPGRAFQGYYVWHATGEMPPPDTITVRFRGWVRRVPVTDGPRLPPRPAP